MKKLILILAFACGTFNDSFSQTPIYHPKADSIYASLESLDATKLSNMFKEDINVILAINDCQGYAAETSTYNSSAKLSNRVITLIHTEIGEEFIEIERTIVSIDEKLFSASRGMMVIYKGGDGKRVKINLFLNDDFEIEYVTVYKSTCNYF